MSTLPPGVTLGPLAAATGGAEMYLYGQRIGRLAPSMTEPGRWVAVASPTGAAVSWSTRRRPGAPRFRTRDQAIRWVCLQARPAVVTVRPVPAAGPDCWDLSSWVGDMNRHMLIRDTPHAEAMTIAMAIALMEATR